MSSQINKPYNGIDVLIVEDSQTQADQLSYLLIRNGFDVRVAKDGLAGLAEARRLKPTLIISDIAMPVMDGFTLCRAVKKDPALLDVPVILLTALTSLHDVIKGLDCGADNFIRKPFEEKYLLARIDFILANRAVRSSERVQLGMKISLGGQTHFVSAERQQIFDLLISTYEEAIQMTEVLREQQKQIARSYQSIEGLYQLAATLNPAITEVEVAQKALQRAMDLPGVTGGIIEILDAAGNFRTVASEEMETEACPAMSGEACVCHRKLLAGLLRAPEVIRDCQLEGKSSADGAHEGSHVSVPLISGERTLGMMNLVGDLDTMSTEEELQVLSAIGNQIAIALERANLYSNMESLVNERTEALQIERNLFSAMVNTTGALVFLADREGHIVAFNPSCEQQLGRTFEEVRGRVFWEVFLPPDRAAMVKASFADFDSHQLSSQAMGEWIARDGSLRKILWSTTYLQKGAHAVEYFLGTGIDVTALRLAEDKVQYLSNFDALTGLPNRIMLRDHITLLCNQVSASRKIMGFFMIDLARLPLIRESLGRGAEQELLVQAAGRLKHLGAEVGRIARVSDSHFAAVSVAQGHEELFVVARKILAILDQPFVFEQQEVHLNACLGVSVFPDDGQDFGSLSQSAEVAMRRADEARAVRYEFYTPELNHGAYDRFKLESALRRALERDELVLHYQPQVDLRTGRVVGFEALLRWQHPELGLLGPNRFIAIAEETGLIVPIGAWVLRSACTQAMEWQRMDLGQLRVAVNLSARQFVEHDLVELIATVLGETGLDARLLDLELTESLVMTDVEGTIGILNALRTLGVQLSIDDFGTGYSSLSYLKRFPINVLKIDQSFVSEITFNSNDGAISDAIISLAHSLGITVIAEGVETAAQCEFLSRKMCDEVQGYLFSRPLPADEVYAFLKAPQSLPKNVLGLHKPPRRLLLVIDDPNDLAALQRLMEEDDYHILSATNGQDALELLGQNHIDVIVSDQDISGMTGVEFLRKAKITYPDTVRVVLTGLTDLASVASAANQGVLDWFFIKPWADGPLGEQLARLFFHKEMSDENRRLTHELNNAQKELSQSNERLETVVKERHFNNQNHRIRPNLVQGRGACENT